MRADAVLEHLPTLYREGVVVGAFAGTWGVQLDGLDEAGVSVQRAHWFDSTPDLDEAVALAALLDIAPEPFHAGLGEFRAWVHAMVRARLQLGAVTREALRVLVADYAEGFQQAAGIRTVARIDAWSPDARGPQLVDNPTRVQDARLPDSGGWEPLAHLAVDNRGLDPAEWAVVLRGTGPAPEHSPLVVNRTTGHAVLFRGTLALGQRLTIAPSAADRSLLRADLDGHDVTDRLMVWTGLTAGGDGPGEPAAQLTAGALARGQNDLWFLPLATYDAPGLGRYLLAMADDTLSQARFDTTAFDRSLFAQPALVSARVAWVEAQPATLEVRLHAATLTSPPGETEDAVLARGRLEAGLDAAVDRTSGAGIGADVVLRAFTERQPGEAHLVGVWPRTFRAAGPTGADSLPDAGATFDVTDFDDSVLS
ncbi:Baseplate protein J-like domain-containing protein OS=Cellulomonas persica OX=76861 GN=CPE01_14590 PE=4 SV=1 [Cellulomonas persica]|uniref:Uncharacterized protein n=2 Tax=Cellulomonas persica TaxID=76861 RepID=A0A510UTA0_9CELL|nr:hypothetical protein CPE01_14590 [Cellulomonas persica]